MGGTSRAICVCSDREVCGLIDGALVAAGVAVEHHDAVPQEVGDAVLVVVDRATRQAEGAALRGASAPVVVVGDDLDDDGLMTLMLEAPVSHLVGDPGDGDLGITSQKLVTGDLWGLEKYLAAHGRIGERVISTDAGKRAAMGEVCTWAAAVGARTPVVHRLASVIDELLMNALHDAPRESKPTIAVPPLPLLRTGSGAIDITAPPSEKRAVLRWGCDDRTIAVSVGDPFGAIRQRDVIDHVRRARDERGRPELGEPGAGLGLYLVLANVASLIVNVDPGRRTEVVCLFDLARRERRAVQTGVRSLHVFAT